MLGSATVLNVTFHSATNLKDVDTGRNDPYIKFTTNIENKDTFQETSVKEDAGANATFEESFTIQVNEETHDLYVEVMDKEKGVDQIIGFAAIPLVQANGGGVNGLFDIYTIKGEPAGLLNITLGEPEDASPRPGKSYINDDVSCHFIFFFISLFGFIFGDFFEFFGASSFKSEQALAHVCARVCVCVCARIYMYVCRLYTNYFLDFIY